MTSADPRVPRTDSDPDPEMRWIPLLRGTDAVVTHEDFRGTGSVDATSPISGPEALAAFPAAARAAADPRVTDIFLNASGGLWVDRGAGSERLAGERPLGAEEALAVATALIGTGGRHIDTVTPCADVHLGDGLRIHAVLPPISPGGAVVSIRVPRRRRFSVEDLQQSGFFQSVPLDHVRAVVGARTNILITGASGSGKTTLLGALLSLAEQRERIVVLEDVTELRIEHPQVTVLQSRQANLEGVGRVGLDLLVREALRMRPDRLVVGECRGAEVRELLAALNTGHDGGAGTLHANSLADVPARLEALGALAGMSERALARQAVSAIGLVIHCGRVDGRRAILQCGRLTLRRSRLGIEPVDERESRPG